MRQRVRSASLAIATLALALRSVDAMAQTPESWCRSWSNGQQCNVRGDNYPVNGTTRQEPGSVEACLVGRMLAVVSVPRYGQKIQIWFENTCREDVSVTLDVPSAGRRDAYSTTVRPGATDHLSHFGFRPEDEPPYTVTARFANQRSRPDGRQASGGDPGGPGAGGVPPTSPGNGQCAAGTTYQTRTGRCVSCPAGAHYQVRAERCLTCQGGQSYDAATETCTDPAPSGPVGTSGTAPQPGAPTGAPPVASGSGGSARPTGLPQNSGAGHQPAPDPVDGQRRRREEEERLRREEEERQRQFEARRHAAEDRQAQRVAQSQATGRNFESTATNMMGSLAGLSVSGDSSRYRGASWRFDLTAGLGMVVIPAVSRGTFTADSVSGGRSSPIPSVTSTSITCPLLFSSLEFWPIHSPWFGIAGVAEGTAGWYGLSSGSTMVTYSGAVGGRLLVGTPWIALLGEYMVGHRYGSESGGSVESYDSSSYGESGDSAEASYGYSRLGAGVRLCFSRGDGGACETGVDGWAIREGADLYQGDEVWGARLALWSTNLGIVRGDLFWDYPRAGRREPSGTGDVNSGASVERSGLNLLISIVKSFDWFGAPYVSPSPPDSASEQRVSAGPPVPVDERGWGVNARTHRGDLRRFVYDCDPAGVPGTVWGTGPYTDDSSVCAAGVHAGFITLSDGGRVVIQIQGGESGYPAGERNGISALAYGDWEGSFTVVSGERSPPRDRDGDGIADTRDRCPDGAENTNGYMDDDGCPDDPDPDGDGIISDNDRCPNDAEDRDGHDDGDGCPDPDNDGDTIGDASDRCPDTPEDRDGFADQDGCPDLDNDGDEIADADDRCPVSAGPDRDDGCPTTLNRIETIPGGVRCRMALRGRRPAPDTDAIVTELVEYLGFRGNRRRAFEVAVYGDGHRASRSATRRSEREAETVRDLLLTRGVDPARLVAVGYGNGQPLSAERSSAARQLNHRVELRAASVGSPMVGAPSDAPRAPRSRRHRRSRR